MYLPIKIRKTIKKWLNTKSMLKHNSNKRMLRVTLSQYWQRYNTVAIGRITQHMHQITCIYIVVSQQKWKHTSA